jgi:class 3 adenylate cyclase
MPDEEGRVKRRLAAILAADVVGYSRLMEKDEEGTHCRTDDCRAWRPAHQYGRRRVDRRQSTCSGS